MFICNLKIKFYILKKIILHLIFTIFIFVNFSHNVVMAFGDEISFSMWNHNMEIQNIPNCHHDDNNNNNDNNFLNCESICCYEKDYTINNSLLSNSNQNSNKKNKIIISFFDIWIVENLVYDFKLIWNTSPPQLDIKFKIKNNLYISLLWIIKSNT